jgi:hypothetical protein
MAELGVKTRGFIFFQSNRVCSIGVVKINILCPMRISEHSQPFPKLLMDKFAPV